LTTCRTWAVTLKILDWYVNAFFVEDNVAIIVDVVSTTSSVAIFAIAPVLGTAAALTLARLALLSAKVLIVKHWIVS
jgi:hypothetical protein